MVAVAAVAATVCTHQLLVVVVVVIGVRACGVCGVDGVQVQAKADEIAANHAALHPAADAKKADLQQKLERELKKEQLRKDFAAGAAECVARGAMLWRRC